MRFAEMFCGIGGFRLGLEKTSEIGIDSESRIGNEKGQSEPLFEESGGRNEQKFRCVWANDIDKYACQIYRKHYGNKELCEGDIRTVNPDSLPDFDLLTAGFPCQSFSLAGKRQGFQDIRGTLFFEVARITSAKRPRLLLLENVKGLLSNDNGRTFAKIIQTLDELGYLVEWQVFNSKYFGVPQNRERVFIIGHLRDRCPKQIFPIGSDAPIPDEQDSSFGSCLRSPLRGQGDKPMIAHALQGGGHSGGLHSQMDLIQTDNLYENKADAGRVYDTKGIARSLKGQAGGLGGKTGLYNKEQRIRRLTPVECERLQGFPDGWTEGVSDTQRYKLLGNAVTTNVISFLGNEIMKSEFGVETKIC